MTEKFKKIDRRYVLSDSSVNEYGFRLLTSGYQMDAFQKNPIGYYMHKREEGIVLKWEDLCVEDDKITATPVINLSNVRGEQTCDEAENGFLNAASVGHIVVLEYSTEPELMLPGQTGPTITKWYNKECSLVDIPGNSNALTRLYDAQENEINLVDLNIGPIVNTANHDVYQSLEGLLQLKAGCSEQEIEDAIGGLVNRADTAVRENTVLRNEKDNLRQELEALKSEQSKYEITAILDRALEDKKLTRELSDKLASDYAGNPAGLKALIAAMPAYRSIVNNLKALPGNDTNTQWDWDDFDKNDPSGQKLKELKANDANRYKELFDKKFRA